MFSISMFSAIISMILRPLLAVTGMVVLISLQSSGLAQPPTNTRLESKVHAAVARPDPTAQARLNEVYGKLPLSFEANRGQTDGQVKFLSRGRGYSLFLTANEAVLALKRGSGVGGRGSEKANRKLETPNSKLETVVRMKLVGANAAPSVVGLAELPSKSNYFIGNDSQTWRTQIPHYAKVQYQSVYPGVDLIYHGSQRQLEYDFE